MKSCSTEGVKFVVLFQKCGQFWHNFFKGSRDTFCFLAQWWNQENNTSYAVILVRVGISSVQYMSVMAKKIFAAHSDILTPVYSFTTSKLNYGCGCWQESWQPLGADFTTSCQSLIVVHFKYFSHKNHASKLFLNCLSSCWCWFWDLVFKHYWI